MELDEIISFLVTLYVLWIFVRGLFSARRSPPPTAEQPLDRPHEPEPSGWEPWEPEPSRRSTPGTGWEAWEPEPSRRSTPGTPLPAAPPAPPPATPPMLDRPLNLSTSHALDQQVPSDDALGNWEEALEAARRRNPPVDAPVIRSQRTARPGRSRAQALLGSRRELLRGIVAHEILGPPVSER